MNTRKLVSLFLALALILSVCPLLAGAAEAPVTLTVTLNNLMPGKTSQVTATRGGTALAPLVLGSDLVFELLAGDEITLTATPHVRYREGQTGTQSLTQYYASAASTTRLYGPNLDGFTFVAWYDSDRDDARLSMDNVYTLVVNEDRRLRADFGETNLRNQAFPSPPGYVAASVQEAQNAVDLALIPGGGVPYDPTKNIYKEIFDKDQANGGDSYYMDRILNKNADTSSDGNRLWSRGRGFYLRTHTPATIGFAGAAFFVRDLRTSSALSLAFRLNGSNASAAVAETTAQRVSQPSNFYSYHTIGGAASGLVGKSTKFISNNNVGVLLLDLVNQSANDIRLQVTATSPLVTQQVSETELTGSKYCANDGVMSNTIYVTSLLSGLFENGAPLTAASASSLGGEITIPAGETRSLRVLLGLTTPDLPDSHVEYEMLRAFQTNEEALRWQKANYNRYWVDETPFIDVPDVGIDKAIAYRWWSERYNSQDINLSGYTNAFPTTNEGANLYNNAIILTQPMHLQDTMWLRSGYMPYGQIMNAGEISMNSAFIDIQAANSWNNHYSQYLASAGLQAYKVIGGDARVAETFARYFAGDAQGQVDHYASDDCNMIGYSVGYMPGNDSDALSFHYGPNASTTNIINRLETAYVYGAANAAATLYDYAGNADKSASLSFLARALQKTMDSAEAPSSSNVETQGFWCALHQMYEPRFRARRVSTNASDDHPANTKYRIGAKESNDYNVFAEYAAPLTIDTGANYYGVQSTREALRYLADDRHFMIFPYYTADQFDISRYATNANGMSGITNNFSNINFTVTMRAYLAALRLYDTEHKYITPGMLSNSISWMAWNIYVPQNVGGRYLGNLNTPNNAEYYSNFNPTTYNLNRNNNVHVNLGNYNWLFFEAMAGIVPRLDDKIELDPIDLGYDHFMVNNVRYHGKDMTVVWQDPQTASGHYPLAPDGFSLYLDGARVATFDALVGFVYDPTAPHPFVTRGENPQPLTPASIGALQGVLDVKDVVLTDARLLANFKKVGLDFTQDGPNLANSADTSASYTGPQRRPSFHNFHTPGIGGYNADLSRGNPASQNLDLEMAPTVSAVVDGSTVNAPFWATNGSPNANDWVALDFGRPVTFDNVRVWFYGDHQSGSGFRPPAAFIAEVWDDEYEEWVRPPQKKSSEARDGLNEILLSSTRTQKLRLWFTPTAGYGVAITEIQVYETGQTLELGENTPPVVSASAAASGNSIQLSAACTDDGLPFDATLATHWSLVSKPTGATVVIASPTSLSTTMTVDTLGAYVVRFEADDGEHLVYEDVSVEVSYERPTGVNVARNTMGSTFQSIRQNGGNRTTPIDGQIGASAPNTLNTWGGPNSNPHWMQITLPEEIYIDGIEIMWCSDGGGTQPPYRCEVQIPTTNPGVPMVNDQQANPSGSTWKALTGLVDRYGQPTTGIGRTVSALNGGNETWHYLGFDAVKTRLIKLDMDRPGSGNGVGIMEWRIFAQKPAVANVDMALRATVGEDITARLPATYDVLFADFSTHNIPLTWSASEVSGATAAARVGETVSLTGSNRFYGFTVTARVYVRPADQLVMVSSYAPMTQTVAVGDAVALPAQADVAYNDGAHDLLAVEWEPLPDDLTAAPGVKEIFGTVSLPAYVTGGSNTVVCTLDVKPLPFTVTLNAIEGGFADGGGRFYGGTRTYLSATPRRGYRFDGWYDETDALVTTAERFEITVTSDVTYTAKFIASALLTITTRATAGGRVSPRTSRVYEGTEITLTATPRAPAIFLGWFKEGACVSREATYTFVAEESAEYEARFVVYVTALRQSAARASLRRGATLDLGEGLTVTPDQATEALVWSSSNPNLAFVDQSGVVTGRKAGSVVVTAQNQAGTIRAATVVSIVP